MLSARIERRIGSLTLDLAFEVNAGETLVLIGENGAGKTTVLRLLAGLERLDGGRIALEDQVLEDPAAGIFVPPDRRAVGWVPQELALFPHLTVERNVSFGLRARGLAESAVRARTLETLERLGIAALAARRPGELSGGQRQRVTLARALAPRPALLLLDEPLASLDARSRREVRIELRRLLSGLPCATVLVTHSPQEAITFGRRVLVLEAGRAIQSGTPDDLLREPRSAHVADLMGMNLLRGSAEVVAGAPRVRTELGALDLATALDPGEVFVAVAPRDVRIDREPPGSGFRVAASVAEIAPEPPLGERLRVTLATTPGLVAEVDAVRLRALGIRVGDTVHASFDSADARIYH